MPVERTATRAPELPGRPASERRSLAGWDDLPAYVLLAEPGSGKSTAFEQLAVNLGDRLIDARGFLNDADSSVRDADTLFIDALDVVRAGRATPQDTMDQIVRRLGAIGRPRFRLACREAEWLASDHRAPKSVSPDGEVAVLRLDPLDEHGISCLLAQEGVGDVHRFRDAVDEAGLVQLMPNPLHLKMLVRATQAGQRMPRSRNELFDSACRSLIEEHDAEIAERVQAQHVQTLLIQAGQLCATLLLSQADSFRLAIRSGAGADERTASTIHVGDLPSRWATPTVLAVLRSKVFVGSPAQRQGGFKVEARHRR